MPLGSVLKPILFNVFINQLLKRLPSDNTVAYADDLTLVDICDFPVSAHQQMQHLLKTVYNWSINNSLFINTSKCYAMYITGSTVVVQHSPAILLFFWATGE